jgi:hypothetical protein
MLDFIKVLGKQIARIYNYMDYINKEVQKCRNEGYIGY